MCVCTVCSDRHTHTHVDTDAAGVESGIRDGVVGVIDVNTGATFQIPIVQNSPITQQVLN